MKGNKTLHFLYLGVILLLLIALFSMNSPETDSDSHEDMDGHSHSGHSHDAYEVSSSYPVPSVDLIVHKDTKAGYNLEIKYLNYKINPLAASTTHREGEGHAHVYVNGEKINRLYGNWYYLESLPEGHNTIKITLSTNDHRELTYNGMVISDEEVVMNN